MKVIQVIGGGEKGGSRKYIIQLCRGLIERGHTAEIVCFLEDAVSASAREHEIPVTVLPMGNIFDLRAVSYLKRHIQEQCPDLVHTHGVRGNFVGRLAAKGAGVTVVTTVHSSVYQDYSHPLKKLLYHRIEKATRRYTSRFIAVAGSLKEELERDGIDSEKIDVVYNGITEDFIQDYSDSALREELGLPPEVPILITVGRAEAVKNQEVFLRVCSGLKEQDIDFHGLLVGDGPLLPELRKKSKALGLDDCVSF
ncbi:MAG TPA: glycosyltransferase, partial [Clostridia bacterium]|nr:glycosyltransferase [Clostridia bacterium]